MMRHRDRMVWIGSLVAPWAGFAALALFAFFIATPATRQSLLRGGNVAWVLGLVVAAWALSHASVMAHAHLSRHFQREDLSELKFRLKTGRGHGHWRELMRRRGIAWYGGRSHSGERPRFD